MSEQTGSTSETFAHAFGVAEGNLIAVTPATMARGALQLAASNPGLVAVCEEKRMKIAETDEVGASIYRSSFMCTAVLLQRHAKQNGRGLPVLSSDEHSVQFYCDTTQRLYEDTMTQYNLRMRLAETEGPLLEAIYRCNPNVSDSLSDPFSRGIVDAYAIAGEAMRVEESLALL